MKYAFIDICNTLAKINEEAASRGYDPAGHALPADLAIWTDESLYYNAQPHLPSIQAVHELKDEGYNIFYLTARPLSMIPISEKWLRLHDTPLADVFCSYGMRKGDFLTQFVREHQTSELILMDDAPKEIESFYKFAENHQIETKLIIPRHDYNLQYGCHREIILYQEIAS